MRHTALPPVSELKREAAILRQVAGDDPGIVRLCDAVTELIDAGYTVRRGGGEAIKPLPLPPELRPYQAQWKKPPPEWGEK